MNDSIKKIIELADERINRRGWKIYPDDLKIYGNYLRLFYQSKSLVDTGISSMDDDDMIYGIGIFLVNLKTLEFHDVYSIEEVETVAKELNSI